MPGTSLTVAVIAAALGDLAKVAGHPALRAAMVRLCSGDPPREVEQARKLLDMEVGQPLSPLTTVFSEIRLDEGAGKKHFWLPSPVDEPSYPVAEVDADRWHTALDRVLQGLTTELEAVIADAKAPPAPGVLLPILERWTSRVPCLGPTAATGVSFYDQTRLAAAVANCLHAAGEQDPPFLLVGGDLSGIQSFLYTINPRGALKSLRARSLFLELVAEHAVAELLGDLDRSHVIYNGGGRFYLLLPNTSVVRQRIEAVRRSVNDWLLDEHGGALTLTLASVPFAWEEQRRGAGALWIQVVEKLAAQKGRKFAHRVVEPSFWSPRPPLRQCDVCHRDHQDLRPLTRPEFRGEEVPQACPLCRELYEFGGRLPVTGGPSSDEEQPGAPDHRQRYLARVRNEWPAQGPALTVCGYRYVLFDSYEQARKVAGDQLVYSLGTWYPGAVPLPYCGYAAAGGQLQEMARQALGEPLVAVLRMDVDNLGRIFGTGLPEEHRDFLHLAALSREMALFFKVHVGALLRKEGVGFRATRRPKEDRRVTVVYAGGDDLFITGAWDDTAEAAFDIHRSFARYTGFNPSLHLSGALSIGPWDLPLATLADLAGEAEKKAKKSDNKSGQADQAGVAPSLRWRYPKNRMVFFYRGGEPLTVTWPDAEWVAAEILQPLLRDLAELAPDGSQVRLLFSRSLLHRLAGLVAEWRREGRLVHPRLAYVLKVAEESMGNSCPPAAGGAWARFKQLVYTATALRDMAFALVWADLASRSKGGEQDAAAGSGTP